MYIDVHCHIDLLKDIEKTIKNARAKKVGIILTNGVDVKTNRISLKLAEKYPEIKAALGIYPIDALKLTDNEIEKEIEFIRKNKKSIVAIGEVGMDFKWDVKEKEKQEKTFRKFIKLAKELDKPIIVHSRKAEEECIKILEDEKARKIVMHCFSGNSKLVKRIIENKWTLTIPTCVKHAEQFQKMAEEIPLKQLLCETDSPFLHPDKKKNNEPANVIVSYEKIAELKKINIKDVEKQIEDNYIGLFG